MPAFSRIGKCIAKCSHEIARSCFDMEFYRAVRERPWKMALRYVAILQATLVLVAVLFLAPHIPDSRTRFSAFLDARLPADARIAIEKGRLVTNLPPRFDLGAQDAPVIVDASVEGTHVPDALSVDGILIGRDAIFLGKENGSEQALPLADFHDVTLTKSAALAWVGQWTGWTLVAGLSAFAVLWYVGLMLGSILYALLGALVAMLFGKLFRAPLRFSQWAAVSFHAVTLPIFVNAIFDAAGLSVPLIFTFLFCMFIAAVIADERSRPTTQGNQEKMVK